MPEISLILQNKLASLPEQPGVYLMKDKQNRIIYIGKASSLKKRVSSYFNRNLPDFQKRVLAKNISDIEFIITDSEIEALLLENTLIKKHKPKFNIRLKDDKKYPFIEVTTGEEYPRLVFTRKNKIKANRYFGPYTDAKAARKIIQTINKIFKLKVCDKKLPLRNNERPCLNLQIKKCRGVCQGKITSGEYGGIIKNVLNFLEGSIEPVRMDLQKQMQVYSEKLEYEKAAGVRDIIYDIQKFSEEQKVYEDVGMDQDYIALSIDSGEAVALLFEFRGGALLGRKIFIFENAEYSNPSEISRTFIIENYNLTDTSSQKKGGAFPSRIVTQFRIDDKAIIEQHLSKSASKKITITPARSKKEKAIINMILKNISIISAERKSQRMHIDKEKGLRELMEALNLKKYPINIECFDISNLQGKQAVASMVRFSNGEPDKKNYRRYKIKAYKGPDDPGMIHEAVGRRLQYLINEDKELPDLLLIDGGTSQLSRAYEAARALNIDIRIISLAKRLEEIYTGVSKIPLTLSPDSMALKILINIRDEAHRFAVTYHKKLRDRELKKSVLDGIPDIGEKKKLLLLKHLKSIENIKNSDPASLEAVPGIGKDTAKKIYDFFHR